MDKQPFPHPDTQEISPFFTGIIGREKELRLFDAFLQDGPGRIINLYGQGGIGKTFLLHAFEQRSLTNGVIFIRMDSSDFTNTPTDFLAHVNLLLGSYTEPCIDTQPSFYELKARLSLLASTARVVIAIDNYDKLAQIDRWFRQFFLGHIDPTVKVILSGRRPLQGEWIESSFWAAQIKKMPLQLFEKEEIARFLKQNHIKEKRLIQSLTDFTEGHPLALKLASLSVSAPDEAGDYPDKNGIQQVLFTLTRRWLEEVTREDLLELIEAAVMVKTFNQHTLSVILEQDVTYEQFTSLTRLSFVQQLQNHWRFHELIQDAISVDLARRNPETYKRLKQKVIAYYKKRLIQTRNADDIAMFFYHIGDELIQSVFFHSEPAPKQKFYMEAVDEYNFSDVIRFFEKKKHDVGVSKADFYNRVANRTFRFYASYEHNKQELALIGPEYIRKMGLGCAKLLRDYSGNIHALSVVIPVHERTITPLSKEPVSRAYFNQLSKKDWHALNVPKDQPKAYFIRLLDYVDATDQAARIAVMYDLLPLLLTGARIIVSSPLTFFQELVKSFGFTEIPEAAHQDYGQDSVSRTYELDLAPEKFAEYLSRLSPDSAEVNPYQTASNAWQLTEREAAILTFIMDGQSNRTIAKALYLAEITVKKHISRIFIKAGVKNRAQLVRKVMEQIN